MDHLIWVAKVMDVLIGKANINSSELSNHNQCRLGKWYSGVGKDKYGHLQEFVKLGKIHPMVHETGKAIVDAVNSGNKEKAYELAKQLEKYKYEVVSAIDNLSKWVLGND